MKLTRTSDAGDQATSGKAGRDLSAGTLGVLVGLAAAAAPR